MKGSLSQSRQALAIGIKMIKTYAGNAVAQFLAGKKKYFFYYW